MNNLNPKHIAVILDGNRRWAKEHNLQPWQGHLEGYKNVKRLLDWIHNLCIKEVTLYGFSIQNKSREKDEVNSLVDLFCAAFKELLNDNRVWKNKIKINIIGRINTFPQKLQKILVESVEKTKNHNNYILNFALAYGGQEEIVDACKNISALVKKNKVNIDDIDVDLFNKHVYLESKPDIIIRTGKEKRISNFLLWQSAYSELFFPNCYWPDFKKENLIKIIDEYKNIDRRFGK